MNDEIAHAMIAAGENPIWVYDTYRRFLQDFAMLVYKADYNAFEDILSRVRKARGVIRNNMLLLEDLEEAVAEFKQLARVPADPWKQLLLSISALYDSWCETSAKQQRLEAGVKTTGLSVIVQQAVFGNKNMSSGSGVVHTRNPKTGEKVVCGKFIVCGQGYEPKEGCGEIRSIDTLQYSHIDVFDRLYELMTALERHYRDMQEIDFVFEDDELYVLQSCNGRRSLVGSLRILVSLVDEGLISEKEALLRVHPTQMRHFLTRQIDPAYKNTETYYDIGKGQSVTEGVVTGCLVFTVEEAQRHNAQGEANILVTDRNDPRGFEAADGVIQVTKRVQDDSYKTLRHLHKVAIVSVSNMHLDLEHETLSCRHEAVTFHRDDLITLDGYKGIIYKGEIPTLCYIENQNFLRILRWADHYKRLVVKGIVREAEDIHAADLLGADGVIFARVEPYMPVPELGREMFVAQPQMHGTDADYSIAHVDHKYKELIEIFRTFDGRRVTFRLSFQHYLAELFAAQLTGSDQIKKLPALSTTTPVEAIVGGVIEARRRGIVVTPCILIPDYLQDQMEDTATLVRETFKRVAHAENMRSSTATSCEVGVMVESVKGCLLVDSLIVAGPVYMDCVCFCADHITESFFGDSMSVKRPTKATQHRHTIMTKNPYAAMESQTVGDLIRHSIQKCVQVNPSIMVIVTGERCGDLSSVQYINWLSANSIVCPAALVPVVKIAAAQAQIRKVSGGDEESEEGN